MGAMAVGLDIKLSKPDVYVLNPDGQDVSLNSVSLACAAAMRIFCVVLVLVVGAFLFGLIK